MSEALADSVAAQQDGAHSDSNPFSTPLATPGTEEIVTSLPVDHYGTMVYVKAMRHIAPTKPPMILVHDVSEHLDFYQATAEAFLAGGYSVYRYDLRGHGRSGRQLGHAPSFDTQVMDLLQVAAWVRYEEGGKPPIIVGQGVGALIAMDFSKAHRAFCQAVVLCAPCFELIAPVTAVRRVIIKVLADFLPMVRIPWLLKPRLSRERPLLQFGHDGDQMSTIRFPGLTALFTNELLLAIKRGPARFVEYRGTALVLCPEKDTICSYQALKKAAAVHQETKLEVACLSDTTHRVFTGDEASRVQAVGKIISWLALKDGNVGPLPQLTKAEHTAEP